MDEHSKPPCEEIIELINDLVDGDATPEQKKKAERLICEHPRCRALYKTLMKTVMLFKKRCGSLPEGKGFRFDWNRIEGEE